jgi:hypothetical protein
MRLSMYELILKEVTATHKTANDLLGNPQIVHKVDHKNFLQQIQLPRSDDAVQTGHHQIKTPLKQHHPNKVTERPVQLGGKILARTKDQHPKQQKMKECTQHHQGMLFPEHLLFQHNACVLYHLHLHQELLLSHLKVVHFLKVVPMKEIRLVRISYPDTLKQHQTIFHNSRQIVALGQTADHNRHALLTIQSQCTIVPDWAMTHLIHFLRFKKF